MKFKSVFQCDANTEKEIQIPFSKLCENKKRKSNLLFKVRRKMKNENLNSTPFFKVS